MTHLFSCTLHQATIDNEVAVLIKLKEQYQKLTGESLGGGDKKKGKDKPKAKKQPEEGKGAAKGAGKGKKEGKKPQQEEVVKDGGEPSQKKITRCVTHLAVEHGVCGHDTWSLSSLGWGWRLRRRRIFQNGIVK